MLFVVGFAATALADLPASDRELFALDAVVSEPLDGKVIESNEKEGVVIETIEFTTRSVGGVPERVHGILAYPKGGKNLPAIFWSMGGMSPANSYFPEALARKGYASLAITLPHKIRDSWARFAVDNPAEGNLTLLARDQLRGISYLAQRQEVDPERIGVGGSSYGGMFSTLLAGIDSRIKVGLSFFADAFHGLL